MKWKQEFIVEGKWLGECMRGPVVVHEALLPPRSYAFFCPTCGKLWARAPVWKTIEGNECFYFNVWTLGCQKHSLGMFSIPGSLFLTWDKPFNDNFPDEVLAWELDRHLAMYPED